MRTTFGILIAATVFAVVAAAYGLGLIGASSASDMKSVTAKSIYEFDVLDIDGNKVNLSKYKGKVVMFVNTASKCGYTPQYAGLQAIYDKYRDRGFVVLGFPANNFGGQEPGNNEEIKEFCTLKYKVTFPMFAKISVKGEDQHPLYSYLTSEKANPEFAGEITWNFNKILANDKGEIIARFSSKETPESPEVTKAIESALEKSEESAE
ncbi:MAG TPA: glutathione peroxidase [Aridibacter sp.]|nr:glutathione peroxidase [Aridibacter sp.]